MVSVHSHRPFVVVVDARSFNGDKVYRQLERQRSIPVPQFFDLHLQMFRNRSVTILKLFNNLFEIVLLIVLKGTL